MAREDRRMPCAGPIGALGISSETRLDLARDRRTTTKAPPAEMFTAVANSSDSLPFSSRLRTKTGIASCSRAHLRCSLLGEFRLTACPSETRINHLKCRRLGAKPRNALGRALKRAKPRYQYGNYLCTHLPTIFGIGRPQLSKSATFFASVPSGVRFQLTVQYT